jgi:hypothetical protein
MTHLRCIAAAVSGETRMTMILKSLTAFAATAVLLAGCTSMNVFKDDTTPPPAPDLAPEEPPMQAPVTPQVGGGTPAAQISKKIAGKSWKWTSPNYSGVTLYANDGSSLIELKGKSALAPVTTTGRWEAKNGQLCESVKAAPPVLTADIAMTCKPFTSTGNSFTVGKANFVLDN